MSEPYVGQRRSFGGDLCTIRYIGTVNGVKGSWLGVEWDDTTRGKHDGQANGKRYFECRSKAATAGSFIRPNRTHDATRSFLDALKYKYAPESIDLAYSVGDVPTNRPIMISGKEVEEVGFDKVRKQLAELDELRIVILDGLCIVNSIGDDEKAVGIDTPCLNASELDLGRNLFEHWQDVMPLITPLGDLQVLRLDGNRFGKVQFTEAEITSFRQMLGRIRELSLENTLLSWSEVSLISSVFTGLKTLTLANNEYTSIPSLKVGPLLPTSITSINLEWNDLTALSDLQPLQTLPNLAKLTLKHNQISGGMGDVPMGSKLGFSSSLAQLDLSYNNITEWDIITTLQSSFPGLTALRISHNPLFGSLRNYENDKSLSSSDGFMLTMARLPRLQSLNYTAITAKDRLNSDLFYLGQIAAELRKSLQNDEPAILRRHPRWQELCEEYGTPDVTRRSEQRIDLNSIQARLITCNFHRATRHPINDEPKIWTAELPASLSMYAVHGLVGRAFQLEPAVLKLFYETGEVEMVEQLVDSSSHGMMNTSWDSDDGSSDHGERATPKKVDREIELIVGTRNLSTWLESNVVNIRVEAQQ